MSLLIGPPEEPRRRRRPDPDDMLLLLMGAFSLCVVILVGVLIFAGA